MITTIVFDLDGTLMNTLDDLHASVCVALKSEGLPVCPKGDVRRYLGNGVRHLVWSSVEQVCPTADEAMKERVLAAFREHYMLHSMDRTAPYDGVLAMLAAVRERGLLSAIVSNKPDAAVKDLHREFFADYIDIAIGETAAVKRKPAPDMVFQAIEQLSVVAGREIRKDECVYVGDSEVDLATARNAGLRCIAVSWGFRDRDVLIANGAETIIDEPKELLDLC